MSSLNPFVTIEVADKDITEYVVSFSYEDCVNEDNLLRITLSDSELLDMFDDGVFDNGNLVTFTFGYLQDVQSATHVAVIFDVIKKYNKDTTLTLNVSATDKGTVTKEGESLEIWEKVTSSEIAKTIADKYNLKSEIEDTSKVWESLPQSGRTDFELLKYLAATEEGGNFIFFIKEETLYFGNIGSDNKSSITFEYGKDDRILNFQSSLQSITENKEADKLEVLSFDPFKNEAVTNIVDNKEGEEKGISLGEFKTTYSSGSFEKNVGKIVVLPAFEKIEVKAVGNSIKKKAEYKHLVATLTLEGNPLIEANSVITMGGKLVNADLGNWFVEKVTQKISGNFTTTINLIKNASKHKVKETEKKKQVKKSAKLKVNTTKGKKKKEETKTIYVFGADGCIKKTETKVKF